MRDGGASSSGCTPLSKIADPKAPIVYGIVQPGPEVSDGVPFVQSRDVGGRLSSDTMNRTSPRIASQYKRSRLAQGDIVFSLRGNIGQSSLVSHELEGANISRGVARIRVSAENDPEFVRYMLQGHGLQKLIARNANGSTFRELSIDELRKLPIPVVPPSEQSKIAEILRTWDEAIETLEALRSAKEQQYRAIARRCFDPCHPTFQNRPNDWREYHMGEVFHERREIGHEQDRLLSITMNDGVIDRDAVGRRDTSTEDKSKYKLIQPGDIGYNTMRMWQGVSGLSTLRGIISPAYTVVRPIEARLSPRFAVHLFKSPRMMFDFQRYSQGLTSDTWNLKFPAFSGIKVFFPPLELQERQAELLDALREEASVIAKQLEVLSRQKRGLMQKLLTGEWRVSV